MARPGFWMMLLALALTVALSFLVLSSSSSSSRLSDSVFPGHVESFNRIILSRRLKESLADVRNCKVMRDAAGFRVQDYPSYDPVPSSKAAVKPGPIEHGAPLLPYIPGPAPPSLPAPPLPIGKGHHS